MSLPVEVWYGGDRYNLLVPEAKKVVKVTIDPKKLYPDVRRENNVWEATTGRTGEEQVRDTGSTGDLRFAHDVPGPDSSLLPSFPSSYSVASCHNPLSISIA